MCIEQAKGIGMTFIPGPVDFIFQKDEYRPVSVPNFGIYGQHVSYSITLVDFSGRNL
jgi:hypothetical protein